jgi:hypothetical protein
MVSVVYIYGASAAINTLGAQVSELVMSWCANYQHVIIIKL